MREFEHPIRNLRVGLRPEGRSRNTDFLSESACARPGQYRLQGYSPEISNFPPVTVSGVALNLVQPWPFPQVFQTDSGIYLGTTSGVYQILTMGTATWTAAKLGTWSGTVSWPWTIANCPMFPVFCSGDLMVYYDYDSRAWISWDLAVGSGQGTKWNVAWPQPVTCCYNNGQFMMGGAKAATTAPSQTRIIRWSQINSFDFAGNTAEDRYNAAGFMYLPTDDDDIVLRILPLGKNFVAYSNFGVFILYPVNERFLPPTFGWKMIHNVGIPSVGAAAWNGVDGAGAENVFVDRLGQLHHISSTFVVTNKGYDEFLLPMLADPLLYISYNPAESEYYLGDGQTGYLSNKYGFGTTNKCITSMIDYRNVNSTHGTDISEVENIPIGLFYETGGSQFLAVTDTLDFGIRGIKTIQTVEVGYDAYSSNICEVAIDYRYDKSSPFRRSPWKRVNKEGVVVPMVAGVDLRVAVRATPYDVDVDYINVRWKLSDRRHIRGVYSNVGSTNS